MDIGVEARFAIIMKREHQFEEQNFLLWPRVFTESSMHWSMGALVITLFSLMLLKWTLQRLRSHWENKRPGLNKLPTEMIENIINQCVI